jgi:putative ABC transport system substrate-binding protein
MPVVGFLSSMAPSSDEHLHEAFRRGLAEGGYIDGQNVAIDCRLAGGRLDRLPDLAAGLVHRQVSVIAAAGSVLAVAAKTATQTF